MKPVTVCVPVLKRYDLLRDLLESLTRSTIKPNVCIIDNGMNRAQLLHAVQGLTFTYDVLTPSRPMGVAESWNWFIKNISEERVITNDDIIFAPDSLRVLTETKGLFVTALLGSNACSCFNIRDECVEKIGFFDEEISPGYAYFEDCDYDQRLQNAGLDFTGVDCGIVHLHSQTLAAMNQSERDEHHKKFVLAQNNFIKKHGHMPHGKEKQFA